ncbi:PepSY domain-containing protein [Thiomonas sp. FB-6]|uniref:PepSY domain-containing protein n=1 Tax=Thiomonas sp. FB-6 TaxID=1158291 RepID=UPI00036548DB|nr:PepSY domain-containing protein [Thiomonas sp. FB-6]
MKLQKTLLIAGAAGAALMAATAAHAYDGQKYAKDAAITMEQASQIALKAVPGATITDRELEREKGGSGLRYSFDLKTPQGERELGVDARTGKVLEDSVDGPNKD